MEKKLTVIVSVYNKKEYLKECIESLIQQTYDGLNIIIVDDGSNDGSELICDFYSSYSFINVIHKQNQGCISSRYEGLKNATTEYVTFVDGDDFVKKNMYEFLMNFAAECDADIITGGCVRYWDKDDYKVDKGSAFEEGAYNKEEIMETIVPRMLWEESKDSWTLDPSLCFKIIKKDIILKEYELLKDETFTYGEDTAIMYPLIFQAKKIYLTNEILYYHRQRERNVTAPYILSDNFFENTFALYSYLKKRFNDLNVYLIMEKQLDMFYMKSILYHKKKYPDIEMKEMKWIFPFGKVEKDEKIILYGAGQVGKQYYKQIMETAYCKVILWVDKNINEGNITSVDNIFKSEYDKVVIAIRNKCIVESIAKELSEKGVNKDKIVF